MNDNLVKKLKGEIIEIGQLMWDKDLVTGFNGNISARVEKEVILLTGRGTCLGRLKEDDLVLLDLDGNVIEGGKASSERPMHTEIYRNFSEVQAVLHTHTTYTNAYFSVHKTFSPLTYEARFYLGEVEGLEQSTPSVTDTAPVIAALKKNSIVVLRNHGVVAMGKTLFDCFVLIQGLEEAIKLDAISRLFQDQRPKTQDQSPKANNESRSMSDTNKKYKLFSKEQIDEIVRLVNTDAKLKELGEKTQMTMDLAVKLNETGQLYSFSFKNGFIAKVGSDSQAEFVVSAPENIWRAVFNREIDPFVATTQKKMDLKGDFAKISKWYTSCSRLFELWAKVPVE